MVLSSNSGLRRVIHIHISLNCLVDATLVYHRRSIVLSLVTHVKGTATQC